MRTEHVLPLAFVACNKNVLAQFWNLCMFFHLWLEEFMTWCVRLVFNLDENFALSIDCPVDTYTKVLLEPDLSVVN